MSNSEKSTFERDYELVRDVALLGIIPKWLRSILSWILILWMLGMGFILFNEVGGELKVLVIDVLWDKIILGFLKVIMFPILYMLGFNLS